MRPRVAVPLALAGAAVAGIGYAAGLERNAFVLRRVEIPVLPRGARPLRVLQISDAHLTPGQARKREWIRSLAALEPDLVVNTGDSIAHQEAVPAFLEAVGPLLDRPGAFVLGSNDLYEPVFKNPAKYLLPDDGKRVHGPMLPWQDLRDGMRAAGWADLTNARGRLKVDGREIELVGVDDPHLELDRYDLVSGPPDPSSDFSLGVLHSPEPRVLDKFAADGFPLVLAGHTHGGQLRVPLYGALVTNCGIDRARARGLSAYGPAWLHVSAGLGTSPYAPVRFACPPEASLLTLVPAG
ncbi:MAG: metallophosphoesterase [Actinomycetes bacterium]